MSVPAHPALRCPRCSKKVYDCRCPTAPPAPPPGARLALQPRSPVLLRVKDAVVSITAFIYVRWVTYPEVKGPDRKGADELGRRAPRPARRVLECFTDRGSSYQFEGPEADDVWELFDSAAKLRGKSAPPAPVDLAVEDALAELVKPQHSGIVVP